METSALHQAPEASHRDTEAAEAWRLLAAPARSAEHFFATAAEALATGTGSRAAGVALLSRDRRTAAVQAIWQDGAPGEPFALPIEQLPCAELYASSGSRRAVRFDQGAAERFPESAVLSSLSAESYRAELLHDATGEVVGHLFTIGDRPAPADAEEDALFEAVRDRAIDELARWGATDRMRAFEHAFSMASDYIATIDLSYAYLNVNPSYLEAFSWGASTPPRSLSELHGPRSFEAAIKPLIDRCFDGERVHTQGWFDLPERRRQFLDISIVPYRLAPGGAITGAILSMRNVTALRIEQQERRGLEARLEQQRKVESLGLMAGGIAHDFNDLLVGMLGGADLLLTEQLSDSGQRTARTIKQSALLASDLCRKMLTYAGRASYSPNPADLASTVREAVSTFAGSLPERISVELDLKPHLENVELDSVEIQQIVRSLILNAGQAYGSAGGCVTVATGSTEIDLAFLDRVHASNDVQPGQFVFVQVSDRGCGIDRETRRRVFDPFFSTKPTGRGLGLAATLGVMRAHGGCVQLESQPGVGTTVRLFFPACPGEVQRESLPASTDESAGCILVVDDEAMVRDIAQSMLERAGFEVVSAATSAEAITLFSVHAPRIDAVLLDASIQGSSCDMLVDKLLTIDPTARIVICSGHSASEPSLASVMPKSYGFLGKPFAADVLVQKVEDTTADRNG